MDLGTEHQAADGDWPERVVEAAEFDAMAGRCIVRGTRKAAHLLTRAFNIQLRESGLEATQFWTLAAIAEGNRHSAMDLARSLGVEKSTLKRSLDLLDHAGLILCVPGEGRRVTYRLTEAGRQKLEKAMPLWRRVEEEIERFLPQGRAADIRSGLDMLKNEGQRLAGSGGAEGPVAGRS